MGRTVSIGAQYFESIRERDCFYIDKTNFIKEWWESGDEVTLITRPRRFGKTLNMSMLECFFSNKYAGRSDLFEGLNIWKEEKFRKLQGKYPVIFLTFADIKSDNFRSAVNRIKESIEDIYRHNRFLTEGNLLEAEEKEHFVSVRRDMSDDMVVTALRRLMEYLERYYGEKVIVLLDEYDTPMQEAYVSGYWDEITPFFRNFFNATFKTNPYMKQAILTGITRISRESIFSDLNNLRVFTATSSEYSDCFGFTENEVLAALEEMEMQESREEVKTWYDGFTFGTHKDIYNPWSITNYLKTGKLGTYWADTSSNGLISHLLRTSDIKKQDEMKILLEGGVIEKEIDEQVTFSHLEKKKNALWSLMLASGYLRVDSVETDSYTMKNHYSLKLTNLEVRIMFDGLIQDWFDTGSISANDFVCAMLEDKLEEMNYYMNDMVLNSLSYLDAGKEPSEIAEPEKFYHGFVLGLLVDLRGRYMVTSNRESGLGRYDIMLEPLRDGEPAFILEFKVQDPKREANLEATVAAALKQIEDKKYASYLEEKGIPEKLIRRYGFAFRGKEVLIG